MSALLVTSASADISEYFLRDPYDQLDLFRQSTLQTREKTSTTSTTTSRPPKVAEATEDQGGKDEIFEEYFDYLYDVGALEKKTTTPEPKQRKIINRLRPRKGYLEVNAD